MATIKTSFGISTYTKTTVSATEKGVALSKGYSEDSTSKLKLVYPQLNANDRYIDSSYTLFSFPLSREWVELGFFLTPKFTLIIEGRNIEEMSAHQDNSDGVVSHIKVLRQQASTGTNLICEWNKYFGIVRFSINTSLLKEFNEILAVGVVMTTNNGEKATGRIFRFDDNSGIKIKERIDSIYGYNTVENIGSYEKTTRLYRLTGAKEDPVYDFIDVTDNRIMIAPIKKAENYYSLSGAYISENDKRSAYTNSTFYYNAAYFSFHSIKHLGSYIYPDSIKIDDDLNFQYFNSRTKKITPDENGIYGEYKPSNFGLIYGGYEYSGVIEDKSIIHYSNFGKFEDQNNFNEELFYEHFNLTSGEQYRTRFEEYVFNEGKETVPNDVKLICGEVYGKMNTRTTTSPLEIDAEIHVDGTEENLKDDSDIIKGLYNYIEVSAKDLGIINRFTKEVEADANVKIRIPVYDQYDYYFLGSSLSLTKNGQTVKDCSNTQAIVKYADMYYADGLVLDNLYQVTNSGKSDIQTIWDSKITKTPQSFFPKGDNEQVIENESYFEYRKPIIKKTTDEEITDRVKFYWNFEYYEILCSRAFPTSNTFGDKLRIHSLKIQDNKLYYQISPGAIGDWNESFSVNQFINYGIDGKRPIGLSSFDGNKKLKITPIIGTTPGEPLLVETKNEDSASTLRKFYTDILHTIDIEPEKVAQLSSALSTQGGTLSLKLTYYDDNDTTTTTDDYTIFEFVVDNISIISGSRPLGLRKNGIIINPKAPNEDLENGVAEKIYLKANIETSTPEGATTSVTTASGGVIEMLVNDNNGVPLKNKKEQNIKCNIEYRGTQKKETKEDGTTKIYYEGDFFFDGVNLSELKNTVGNSGSGLVKDVNDNKTDIANLKGLQIFTITKNKIGISSNHQY